MFGDNPKAEYTTLEKCCTSVTGGNTPSMKHEEYYGGDVPFIKSGDVKDRYVSSGALWLTQEALDKTTAKYVPEGSIIVVVRSGILKHDLPVAIAINQVVINQDLKAFQPKQDFESQYLAWAIRSRKDELLNMTKAMTVDSIDSKILYEIPVMIAPITMQKQFTSFVEQSDKSKFIGFKSQFIEMFGDPVDNTKELPSEPLSKHLELIGGFAFKSKSFVNEGIPVLRIGNINAGYFKSDDLPFYIEDPALNRYMVYPGDLVISLTGTVGKDDYGNVCKMGNDYPCYYLNQRNAKILLKPSVTTEYITALLKNRRIKDKIANAGQGVRQANISNKSILDLVVPVPTLEEQEVFASIVKQSDKSK